MLTEDRAGPDSTAPAWPRRSERAPGRHTWWLLGGLVLLAVGVWACWSTTIDDALITYRYSSNLADGYGPTWNPGQDPVEGFTNFAWMIWHAPFAALGAPLPVVSKLTSAACAALTLAMLVREPATGAGRFAAVGSYLLFLPTYIHITAGLETAAFALVLLRAGVLAIRALRGQDVRAWELPLLLIVGGMLRPEGAAAILPALLVWAWPRRRDRAVQVAVAAALLVGIAYFAWRASYYGQLLPNTFYVKFGNVGAGQKWLQLTAAALLPLLALTVALVLRRSTSRAGITICAMVAFTYVTYAVSGPSMDYMHRFAFHAVPLLCLAAGLALDGDMPRRAAALVAAVAVAWTALAGLAVDDGRVIVNYGRDLDRAHAAIGRGLAAAQLPPAARSLASSDAGAIPYYSRWAAIDYIGLNDEAIAQGAAPTTVVTAARPTVVVVTSSSPTPPAAAYGLDIPAATAGYEQIATAKMRDGYWQLVYATPQWAPALRDPVNTAVAQAQQRSDGRWDDSYSRWIRDLI